LGADGHSVHIVVSGHEGAPDRSILTASAISFGIGTRAAIRSVSTSLVSLQAHDDVEPHLAIADHAVVLLILGASNVGLEDGDVLGDTSGDQERRCAHDPRGHVDEVPGVSRFEPVAQGELLHPLPDDRSARISP
jgi:hypothetical protein